MSGTVENMLRLARESDTATRAMLARNATTPHEVLAFLSQDEEPRVRASVIANAKAPFSVLQTLTEDESAAVREALAKRVADILPSLTSSSHDRLAQVAQPILLKLAEDAVAQIRFIIADAIKNLSTVPRDAVLRLAMDTEIRVAEPVIRLSPILTEQDLLVLVASPPTTATLQAVARRNGIGEAVTDALIAQGDRLAIGLMLENTSAKIRAMSMEDVLNRARFNPEWFPSLMARPGLTPDTAIRLAGVVADTLLRPLMQRQDVDPALLFRIRQCVADRLGLPQPNLPAGMSSRQIDPVSKGFPAKSMVWRTDNNGPRF
ncbi:MAG: DUF2336 domain-containing protein [Roseomonas sp.]|nr:DUF2336 domain-containing protein [Roseomonas sp.]MCA3368939.1 DUF2336 domain-containing protein [Roseomonas sp.]